MLCCCNRSRDPITEGHYEDGSYMSSLLSKVSFDGVCLLGLVSTVTSLKGYWLLLDCLVLPAPPLLTLLAPAALGFGLLAALRLLSTLHGGIVTVGVADIRRGALLPSWLVTYWLTEACNVTHHVTSPVASTIAVMFRVMCVFRKLTSEPKTVIDLNQKLIICAKLVQ